jgi:hypothetical protein
MSGFYPIKEILYKDNAFKLVRQNESILISVKVLERLTQAFSLQALHELGEFVV